MPGTNWPKLRKNARFDNLVHEIIAPSVAANNYRARKNVAVQKVYDLIQARLAKGLSAFNKPPKPRSPPKPRVKAPVKAGVYKPKYAAKRLKIEHPNTGTMVFADRMSEKDLRKYARQQGINVSNATTKAAVELRIIFATNR